jgi:hypothetical protein
VGGSAKLAARIGISGIVVRAWMIGAQLPPAHHLFNLVEILHQAAPDSPALRDPL